VGSEMCIRDRNWLVGGVFAGALIGLKGWEAWTETPEGHETTLVEFEHGKTTDVLEDFKTHLRSMGSNVRYQVPTLVTET
jgi:hypothetical protein